MAVETRTPRPTPAQREVLRVLAEGGRLEISRRQSRAGGKVRIYRAVYDAAGRERSTPPAATVTSLLAAGLVETTGRQPHTLGWGATESYGLTDAGREALK